ncbi:acetylcholine receptor subunit alpha-L1 isoform X2 [Folsomia candida]|uniref:acetylcholine receptor subunit alpha-L1 isoform X1 n=1 Tax=Folsomia candida TaxID=158441 RepID=UPI000B8F4762|nr:acetylcholine receptor subunit alpha-L1 isoform X1 [Folsomia candida]XP_035706537.1 acetylcholine receptor subunit alpha-L1 isoform X2 [Folsomia candida]
MIPSDSTAFQRVRCHQDDADTRTRSRFKTTTSTRLLSSPAINFSRYCHPGTICVRRFNGYIFLLLVLLNLCPIRANPDAKRLYDDLLSNYNRLIRPVYNNTDTVLVRLGLRLSQLLDLDLKNQIMTTNVWLDQSWFDNKFIWDPKEYGGVTELYVPSEHIWLPDIVLYNNADGDYIVTTMTKAVLHSDGVVTWKPPAIFKSSCEIDVRYFPYDMQQCFMKFGSWTYDGFQIDLKHINQEPGNEGIVDMGINLLEFYPSVEWDILSVPAERHERFYPCCEEPYPDIFFNITLRRRTLFYTVNLIIPVIGISYLSILVFYLPADSGEKIALCISILLSQTMFFLLISEIIPSTSLAIPLLGKYLLFSTFLVGLSVTVTTIILNVHYRKPSTHRMTPWVRHVFIRILPKFLLMRVPEHVLNCSAGPSARTSPSSSRDDGCNGFQGVSRLSGLSLQGFSGFLEQGALEYPGPASSSYGFGGLEPDNPRKKLPFEIQKAIHNVQFIQTHMQRQDEFDSEDQDWGFVAMVLDRIFLLLFNTAFFIGTTWILLEAPALYDYSEAIDKVISTIAKKQYSQEQLGI